MCPENHSRCLGMQESTGKENTCPFQNDFQWVDSTSVGPHQTPSAISWVTPGKRLDLMSSISSVILGVWDGWSQNNPLTTAFHNSVICDPYLPGKTLQSLFLLLLSWCILIIAFLLYLRSVWWEHTIDFNSNQICYKQSLLKQKFYRS
jgi:hypothetical protein